MGIEQICQTISNFFNNIRKPFPQLPNAFLICSMRRRPGLSVIQSVANVTKDLNRLGIPTEEMPDGGVNLTIAYTYAIIKEVFRAIKKDMSLQTTILPGSSMIVAKGANGGGPMTVTGTIVNTPVGATMAN